MAHKRIKFTSDDAKEDGVKGWHLMSTSGDGEFTACGTAFDCYDKSIEEEVEKGGITCKDCLSTIRFYKQINL